MIVVFLGVISCQKENYAIIQQNNIPIKSSSYSVQYLNDSLAYDTIRTIVTTNQELIRDYLTAISIASINLTKDSSFIGLLDSLATYFNGNNGVDFYVHLPAVADAYNAKFNRNFLNDLKVSLYENNGTSYQKRLIDSLGLEFDICGISFSPKYFLYYKNTHLYSVSINTTPSIATYLLLPGHHVKVWQYVPATGSFNSYDTDSNFIEYHHTLLVSCRISYQKSNGQVRDFFVNPYEAVGRCDVNNIGWCNASCSGGLLGWFSCCKCKSAGKKKYFWDNSITDGNGDFF